MLMLKRTRTQFFYKALLAILLLVLMVSQSLLFLQIPVNPDGAVFDYIGWVMNEGGVAYVDAADQNWPGQMFIHAFANLVFGNNLWAYRALEIVLIIPLSCFAIYLFCKTFHSNLSALIAVPVYQWLYMTAGFWSSGQRDLLVGPILIAAILAFSFYLTKKSKRFFILHGLFIFFATIIRPTMLIWLPLLFIVDLLFRKQNSRSIKGVFLYHASVAIVILVVALMVMLWGAVNGALFSWFDISIKFSTEVYSQSASAIEILKFILPVLIAKWKAFLLGGFVGLYYLFSRNNFACTMLLMIIPAAFISLLVQGKGFGYHILPILSVLGIVMSIGLAECINIALKNKLLLVFFPSSLIILSISLGLAKKSMNTFEIPLSYLAGSINKQEFFSNYGADKSVSSSDVYLLSEYVRRTTNETDTVLFMGRPMQVNTLAERRSPFFMASFALWAEPDDRFSLYKQWFALFEKTMKESPPEIILLIKEEGGGYRWLPPADNTKKLASVITRNLKYYELEKTVGNVDLFRLKK